MKRLVLAFAVLLGLGQAVQAQTAVGPRAPVGPQASVTCKGTPLVPGANIQSAVNAASAGTTFCLAAGTYAKQSVTPKAGDKFIGAVGAILDGQNATKIAFDGYSKKVANVTIQNLVIKNYDGGYQSAAVRTHDGWRVRNNEITMNNSVGVDIDSNVIMQYNNVHHNLGLGLGNGGGINIQVIDNEIEFSNYTDKYNCNDERGGGKFWATNGAIFSYNYTHDNHGPGIWDDFNNQNITYSFNRIENNYGPGIHHEISYDASIHDNVFLNNGKKQAHSNDPGCTWLWCAAVSIAASGGVNGGYVEVYNNTITPGSKYGNAIGLIQQDRSGPDEAGKPTLGPWHIQNVWVHDNTIDLSKGGNIGGVEDTGNTAMFIASIHNNRFDRNHYILARTTSPVSGGTTRTAGRPSGRAREWI